MTIDLDYLVAHRTDPDARAVLEDRDLETGAHASRWACALSIFYSTTAAATATAATTAATATTAAATATTATTAATTAATAATATATADTATTAAAAAADAAATTATTAATTATATTAAAAAADAAADTAADTATTTAAAFSKLLATEPDMREGLKVMKLPGYYGITRVGWLRRVGGDEYVLLPGTRTIWRTDGSRMLPELAADGPKQDHEMGPPSKVIEEVNRLLVWQSFVANEKVWAKHCPRPAEWDVK